MILKRYITLIKDPDGNVSLYSDEVRKSKREMKSHVDSWLRENELTDCYSYCIVEVKTNTNKLKFKRSKIK